uniref:Uncharacterized protein n=1 Tax=Salix viminalis TaxID=40686 RepID=A0A6N2M6P3_SALVM
MTENTRKLKGCFIITTRSSDHFLHFGISSRGCSIINVIPYFSSMSSSSGSILFGKDQSKLWIKLAKAS